MAEQPTVELVPFRNRRPHEELHSHCNASANHDDGRVRHKQPREGLANIGQDLRNEHRNAKDGKVLLKEFAAPASKEDGAAFAQFLIDSRRVPEVIVILKCSEENSLKRMIDEDGIKKKFDE